MNNRVNAILMFGAGLIILFVFIAGSGILSHGDAERMIVLYVIGFAAGLLILGPFAYQSAVKQKQPAVGIPRSPLQWLRGLVLAAMVGSLSSLFFQSAFFRSGAGANLFFVFVGFTTSVFIPLGIGYLKNQSTR